MDCWNILVSLVLIALFQHRVTGLQVTVPNEVVTYELGFVNITCEAEGTNADVEFTWTLSGDPDFQEDGPELYMEMIMTYQAGFYTCEARTVEAFPETATGTTEIIVWYTPRWDYDAVQKFAGDLGERVIIICRVNAIPTPVFYWQHPQGVNLTSSPDYSIASDGEVSTIEFHSLKSSHYGTYYCSSHNEMGGGDFPIELLEPQAPDAPSGCNVFNVSESTVEVHCAPGFDGGAELTFPVYKSTIVTDPSRAESEEEWINSQQVSIIVKGLSGNTSYSLAIYAENEHGRSEESYGVDVVTAPGNAAESKSDFPVIAVACGAAAGLLLVVGIILCVVCIVCRKNKESQEQTTGFTNTKNTQNYVTEEQDSQSNEAFKRQSAKRSSWGSFRRSKKLWKPGVDNPSYMASSENVDPSPSRRAAAAAAYPPPRVASYSDSQEPRGVSLSHNPGESNDAYDNPVYSNDSMETGFNGSAASPVSPTPEVAYRRQMSNPYDRAKMLARDQPGLAGSGALQNISVPGTYLNIAPLTPKLQKDRRISLQVRPQSFVPEVHWEFPREKLYIRRKLGEGSFGEVWRARAEGILGRKGRPIVAVKMLKQQYTPEERRTLVNELEIMKLLQPHPNIIQLLGCCMQSEPLSIIMEYASNGNLQDVLRKQRNAFEMNDLNRDNAGERSNSLTARDLMIFALHVASGMDYVESKELLHRDLAARNILVDDQMVCKICDFGSARDVAEMRQYESRTQRRLPLRWMAPESLFQCQYSTKSDVWSFGVLFWEIVTLGSSPYPGMSGPQVMEFVQKGCRMKKPAHCTDTVYAIMKDCWSHYAIKRPSFSILRHRLVAILDDPDYDMYIDQMEDNVYAIMEHQPGEKC